MVRRQPLHSLLKPLLAPAPVLEAVPPRVQCHQLSLSIHRSLFLQSNLLLQLRSRQLQHLLHPLRRLRQLHLQHLVTQALRHPTQEQIQALTQLVTTLLRFLSIRFPHLKVLLL